MLTIDFLKCHGGAIVDRRLMRQIPKVASVCSCQPQGFRQQGLRGLGSASGSRSVAKKGTNQVFRKKRVGDGCASVDTKFPFHRSVWLTSAGRNRFYGPYAPAIHLVISTAGGPDLSRADEAQIRDDKCDGFGTLLSREGYPGTFQRPHRIQRAAPACAPGSGQHQSGFRYPAGRC